MKVVALSQRFIGFSFGAEFSIRYCTVFSNVL